MYQINFKTKFFDLSSVPILSQKFKVFQCNHCSNFITVSLLDFITVSWLDLDKANGSQDGCLRMMHSNIIGCTCTYALQSHV